MNLKRILTILPLVLAHSRGHVLVQRGGIVVRPPPEIRPEVEPLAPAPAPRPQVEPETPQPLGPPESPQGPPEAPQGPPAPPQGPPAPPQGPSEPPSTPKQQNPNPAPKPAPKKPLPEEAVFVLPPIPDDHPLLVEQEPLYNLGQYKANQEVLFGNFQGPEDAFMSKVFDYFTAESAYITGDAYASATGSQKPFQSGPKPTGEKLLITQNIAAAVAAAPTATVTSFDPQAPKDVCGLYTSLARYCAGGGGTACACYSSAYYVPDLWNSLAGKCASLTTECTGPQTDGQNYWCSLARSASKAKGFCPTRGLAPNVTPVKFAATAGLPSKASATSTTGVAGYINSGIAATSTASSGPSRTAAPTSIAASTGSASSLVPSLRGALAPALVAALLFTCMIYT